MQITRCVSFGAPSVRHSVRATWPFGAMGVASGAAHGSGLLGSVCHSRGFSPVVVAHVLRQPVESGPAARPWQAADARQQFVFDGGCQLRRFMIEKWDNDAAEWW